MNKASSGLAILVGFALLLGGFYLLYGYVTHTFAGLPSQLKPLVAICSIVALLCAAIVADGLKANAQREFRARVVEERLVLYGRLLAYCCERLQPRQAAEAPVTNAERTEMERSLALAGSSKVVSTYVEFQRRLIDANKTDEATALLDTLVTEMRADLAGGDLIRKQGDVLELLLGTNRKGASAKRPSA